MEFLSPILDLAERFGWSNVALVVIGYAAFRFTRTAKDGICYAWTQVQPYVTDLLSSHSDLMKTATEQMPKQTAILQQLSEGHKELRAGQVGHAEILISIRDTVNRITPVRADGEQNNSSPTQA